jgi:hypothetical protein
MRLGKITSTERPTFTIVIINNIQAPDLVATTKKALERGKRHNAVCDIAANQITLIVTDNNWA